MKQNESPFKWRHFDPSRILLCVRWYRRYQRSYRDLEEVMREDRFALSLDDFGLALSFARLFFLGFFVYTWVANALTIQR